MLSKDENGSWQMGVVEKIVGAVMIGMMGWMALTVQSMSVDLAVVKTQVEEGTRDRFRSQDGDRLEEKIERNEERLRLLERSVGVMKDVK